MTERLHFHVHFLKAWGWLSESPINIPCYFVDCAWHSSTSTSSCSQDELSEWLTSIRSTVRSLWVNPWRKKRNSEQECLVLRRKSWRVLHQKAKKWTTDSQNHHCACMLRSFSHVRLFETQWTVAHHDPLSMGFRRQEYWSGLAIFFSRGSSQPRDWTQAFCIAIRFFTIWATRKAATTTKHYFLPENRLQPLCGWWQGPDAQ